MAKPTKSEIARLTLYAAKDMLAFIVQEYPEDSRQSGNWPTIDPLIKSWQAVIALASPAPRRTRKAGRA